MSTTSDSTSTSEPQSGKIKSAEHTKKLSGSQKIPEKRTPSKDNNKENKDKKPKRSSKNITKNSDSFFNMIQDGEDNSSIPRVEGVLYKWTTYVKGWRKRLFVIDSGIMVYYLSLIHI
eukprot:TRINITY_DN7276_c0_g1_i1.p1 TRINITY_DN7276_c0_g1~~TRINITY_DN7276_c0_g1_i1.p1  ORF type:complete len:128 (+),score=21.83 TRINITY_DN7276_c0_g1_i1:32-385(+)